MTAAKHTPGPWAVSGPSAKGYLIVKGANGQGVALILMDSSNEEADADLIAAAPNLAFQLLAAANYIDALGGDSRSYRQAYAEATGEGA